MPIWIADFWIESTLVLPTSQPELRLKLPDCEVAFQNAKQSALTSEALSAQIVLQADNIADAEELANRRIREILDVLSFTTSSAFKISRPRFLMDWTPGLTIRQQYAYGHDNLADRWPDLRPEHLHTLAEIESLSSIRTLKAPLRWYGAGTRASIAEDQFQYFWLALELIAEITKTSDRVTDKCQRCRGDLFCPACNAISEHRPFPKQAIEALLTKLNVSKERQRDLFKVRNGIIHGRTRSEIEAVIRADQPEFEISKAIDFMWQTAFMAILNALKIPQSKIDRLAFGAPDSIVSRTLTFKAHMHIGMKGDPNEPRLEDVVVPEVTAVRVNGRGEPIDPLTGERKLD
ncbi:MULTISPECIES: methylamine utilization protein MauJ [unclassified Bradyrhizobium]|uniref:methylamine utilization protein MauJ n=1 Tax=unclassified Bradyrhizobium TaxID=2631580 RepID=UPI001FF7EA47|nr:MULTISPECIES: methylamine utilization protein MauJ [unclassified Bradyrhizobium]MCK1311609.1 hypothetical protein [Bradyrhizobium sp. 45]MCK1436847.1 hypothetical protein [Bradyrhizobium sp. 15]MCK1611258.1 hypothetical protein [Bradyrhizobium sp. 163]MCK1761373.1 hypothetical protein [Bradyrhizobium sp. 136]